MNLKYLTTPPPIKVSSVLVIRAVKKCSLDSILILLFDQRIFVVFVCGHSMEKWFEVNISCGHMDIVEVLKCERTKIIIYSEI